MFGFMGGFYSFSFYFNGVSTVLVCFFHGDFIVCFSS